MPPIEEKDKVVKPSKLPEMLDPLPQKMTHRGREARRRLVLPVSGYVQVSRKPVYHRQTLIQDRVFADFDDAGGLVGVEVV